MDLEKRTYIKEVDGCISMENLVILLTISHFVFKVNNSHRNKEDLCMGIFTLEGQRGGRLTFSQKDISLTIRGMVVEINKQTYKQSTH